MGCFGFKIKKASKRKTKRLSKLEDHSIFLGGNDSVVPAKNAEVQGDATAARELTELTVDGPTYNMMVPPQASSGEPNTIAFGVADDVVLRHDLPDGDHAITARISNTTSQVRKSTKEFLIHEIDSLRVELEMRRQELQSLKKDYNELSDTADKLDRSRKRVSELSARVEDMHVQLSQKREAERKLSQEVEETRVALARESREKQLLSQRLEEVEYKLQLMAEASPQS